MSYRLPFILLIIISLFACEQKKEASESLLDYLPFEPSILIKINNVSEFSNAWEKNSLLKISKFTLPDSLAFRISSLKEIQSEEKALLSIYQTDSLSTAFVLTLERPFSFKSQDSSSNVKKESVLFKGSTYEKIELKNSFVYMAKMKDHVVLSSQLSVLDLAIKNTKKGSLPETFYKLYGSSNSEKPASIYMNMAQAHWLKNYSLKQNDSTTLDSVTDWLTFDFISSEDFIHLHGISMAQDSTPKTINLFQHSKPLPLTNSNTAPFNTEAFVSFSIENHNTFSKNQQEYLELSAPKETPFNSVDEVSMLLLGGKKAVFLNTLGTEEINPFLESLRRNETNYQGHEVYFLTEGAFLTTYFDPLIKNFNAKYYAVLENTYMFSEELEVIKEVIKDKTSGNTLDKNALFKTANTVLADESNIVFIANNKGIRELLKDFGSNQLNLDFKELINADYVYAGQLITDKDFYHTNFIIQKKVTEETSLSTSIVLRVELESDLATNPQFVINHRNSEKEIVVQDIDNNLYLISNKGRVIWKKTLNGRIQGKISQVDLYKNNRLQLAFTTNNEFLILDRNGKEVEPFNMKFPGGNLNGLAVFDYEGKKNYRFVITQGKKVTMLNSKGKVVNGFKYEKAESPVIMVPKHLRIGRKDYLVFMLEDGSLKILNRTGRTRVNVKEKIDFSGNEVYLFKDNFITTDKKGTLYAVDSKGKITKSGLNLNPDHGIVSTNRTFVSNNENILKIRGHEVTLELGVYSRPQLFYVNNKIYISVTDIQSQKIYLFDSNAKSISDFPVFGNYEIDLGDMDNDRKIEIVTKEQDNALVVYKVN
ncbi:ribonuclease HII [Eudoraea sp.]|uniref:ribonuclease HII n=1 Tax=Eudoraea sp. TaxID=1979955 RepID=UPI003C745AA5